MQETQCYVKATFYAKDGSGKILPPDTLSVYGIGKPDNLLYNKVIKASFILLPLDESVEKCEFIFKINHTSDTVTFDYNSYPHFISKECGYTFFHKLGSVYCTQNILDTTTIKNNSVIIPNEENIKIFY
jgi:predicted nucleic-acid-binding Zn-ribbon protein